MNDLPSGPLIAYGKAIAVITRAAGISAARQDVILGRLLLFHVVFGGVAWYVTSNVWAAVLPVLLGFLTVYRYQLYLAEYQRQLVEAFAEEYPDADIVEI